MTAPFSRQIAHRDLEAIYRRRSAVSAYVPDPATGGVIGISIMVGVAALLGGMLAVML